GDCTLKSSLTIGLSYVRMTQRERGGREVIYPINPEGCGGGQYRTLKPIHPRDWSSTAQAAQKDRQQGRSE
ncbi:MAG TPA: hypothetical protein PLJ07_08395, partial [Nitrospira sp.]|nr:hypothetical protein [Nitrospira sp.]